MVVPPASASEQVPALHTARFAWHGSITQATVLPAHFGCGVSFPSA
jgi:hypothetical protein